MVNEFGGESPPEHHPIDSSRFEPIGETRAFRHLTLATKVDLDLVLPPLIGAGVLGYVSAEAVDRGGVGPWYYSDGTSWSSLASGAMGPFDYDYLVDHNWSTEITAGRGTEAQEMTAFHGRTFKVCSSVAAVIADITDPFPFWQVLVAAGHIDAGGTAVIPNGLDIMIETPGPGNARMPFFATAQLPDFELGTSSGGSVVQLSLRNVGIGSLTLYLGAFNLFFENVVGQNIAIPGDSNGPGQIVNSVFNHCSFTHVEVGVINRTDFEQCYFEDFIVDYISLTTFDDIFLETEGIVVGSGNFAAWFEIRASFEDVSFRNIWGPMQVGPGHGKPQAIVYINPTDGVFGGFNDLSNRGLILSDLAPFPTTLERPCYFIISEAGTGTDPKEVIVQGSTMPQLNTLCKGALGPFIDSVFGPNAPDDLDYSGVTGPGNAFYGSGSVPATPGSSGESQFFNGTFAETLDADISESAGVVTLSLQQEGTGDLTMRFSSGLAILDCTPVQTIALTLGSDASPQANYIYVLESDQTQLTKSTSQWPVTEHIKVGYYLVPSAGFVAANGCYAQQQWNDHRMGTNNMGHLAHMAERERLTAARYFSGIDPNGTTSYLTISGSTVYYQATSGVIFQMHRHASPAVDTDPGGAGDVALVVNSSVTPFQAINNLFNIRSDSGGNLIGNNKWFNLVIWGVANKSGTYEPTMINVPAGFYNTQASAEQDVSGFDNFDLPREFDLDSSTAFLIARLTVQKQALTWAFGSAVDLRRGDLLGARGGASSPETEFPDNTFNIFNVANNTKVFKFLADQISPDTTRTLSAPDASGTIALTTIGGGDFYIPLGMDIAGAPLTP